MHNELTKKDMQLMKEARDYRRIQLRPQLLEAVKEARAFGDLSENFEYKAAKQEKNRNESRIRFLENMIRTAVVLPDAGASDGVQLYDRVTVFLEDEGDTEVYQVVTTMRQDAQGEHQGHEGQGQVDGGEGVLSHAPGHKHAVHQRVEREDPHGHDGRNGEFEKAAYQVQVHNPLLLRSC